MNEKDLGALEGFVAKAVNKLGFKLMDEKNGFNICAKQNGILKDKYLAIDIITNDEVSMDAVLDFFGRLSKFHQALAKGYTVGWSLEGIIYYTGKLPESVASLADSMAGLKLKFSIKKLA